MMKSNIITRYAATFFGLATIICVFTACEKEEQYSSATINGIKYVEKRTSALPLYDVPPSSIVIWENYNVALYHTLLTPITKGYPSYDIHFWISLEGNPDLETNKSYKMIGMKVSGEYDRKSLITQLKENLPIGYNGIVYCYKEGEDESFPLEGTFKLEKSDANTGYYYGSYQLTHSSTANNTLIILGNFKIVKSTNQLTY